MRNMRLQYYLIGMVLCLISTHPFSTPAQQATSFHDSIAAIAEGPDTAGRRNAITHQLEASGINYRLDDFTFSNLSGTNIVAEVPSKRPGKVFLLGAHYDRVVQGQGVVDNGASCAVLLRLLGEFKSKPLENYSIKAVFFDLEERIDRILGICRKNPRHRKASLRDESGRVRLWGHVLRHTVVG
jgi:hypothetical protein